MQPAMSSEAQTAPHAHAKPIILPGQKAAYYLFREIDDQEAEHFCSALWAIGHSLMQTGGGRITVFINSVGGSMGAGFAMIETMYKVKRELGIPVDTVVLGYAYSMGATLFQAGDHRKMGYFSTMMLHSSSWQVSGRDSEVFTDLKKLADLYQGMTTELFFRRTRLHSPQWWRRFIYSGKERYLSAQECLKLRLVDEVCQFLDECYLADRAEALGATKPEAAGVPVGRGG